MTLHEHITAGMLLNFIEDHPDHRISKIYIDNFELHAGISYATAKRTRELESLKKEVADAMFEDCLPKIVAAIKKKTAEEHDG